MINQVTTNQNIFFGSTKLYSARIERFEHNSKKPKKQDVFITRLDKSDLPRLLEVKKQWRYTSWASNIIDQLKDFSYKRTLKEGAVPSFYAVEVPDKSGRPKIAALAMATNFKKENRTYLDYLQVFSPDYDSDGKGTRIKGAGSCLMYAVIRQAKQRGNKKLSLSSTGSAESFYRGYKFKKNSSKYEFALRQKQFEQILNLLKDKYSIKWEKHEEIT